MSMREVCRRGLYPALLFCLVGTLGGTWGAAPAAAEICAVDPVPAATLLLPYFEVDLEDPSGLTTLVSINNAAAESTLGQVTLWSDLGVAVLSFNVYLTGYDVLTLNLRDVFLGSVPVTDDMGPVGELSLANTQFPDCEAFFPLPLLPTSLVEHVRNSLTGRPSSLFGGLCSGSSHGDLIARGYLTVDVVRRCNTMFPTDPEYFAEDGIAGFDNVLWGDFYYVDPANDFAQGENLVRLEASPETFGDGDATFYGPLVGGSGADAREPLPVSWAGRFLNGGTFTGGTSTVVWRSPAEVMQPFVCSQQGLIQQEPILELVAFDEEENPELLWPCTTPIPFPLPQPFPLASQKVAVADLPCPPLADFGWLAADLRPSDAPGAPAGESQAYLATLSDASGLFSVGVAGTALSRSCEGLACLLGEDVPPARLCVRGQADPVTGVEELAVGEPVQVEIYPLGCFSSSCTVIHQAGCSVAAPAAGPEGSELAVSGRFCLSNTSFGGGQGCLADCGGGGRGFCSSQSLGAGSYRATLGELSVEFSVPSTLPPGGRCDGNPF